MGLLGALFIGVVVGAGALSTTSSSLHCRREGDACQARVAGQPQVDFPASELKRLGTSPAAGDRVQALDVVWGHKPSSRVLCVSPSRWDTEGYEQAIKQTEAFVAPGGPAELHVDCKSRKVSPEGGACCLAPVLVFALACLSVLLQPRPAGKSGLS